MMSEKSKHQKCSNNWTIRLSEDRISNLPSCLILKIISLLPTKNAVVTSVLSTKWKYLWTSIPILELNDNVTDPTKPSKGFKKFVNRVLLLCDKSCLQSFRLKCGGCYPDSLVNAWIASVLSSSNIHELDLSVPTMSPLLSCSDIFRCKTLVVLKLDARGKVNVPTSVCLPILKTLHLNEVKLLGDMAIVSLISACPALEELRLSRCDVQVINIVSPTLITLTIEGLPYFWNALILGWKEYRIILNTPSLKHFNFKDYVTKDDDMKRFMYHLISPKTRKALTDIFMAIYQVRRLFLSCRSMSVIKSFYSFPDLTYLIHMEIRIDQYIRWDPLATLLEKSPSLETFHLIEVPFKDLKNSPSNDGIVPYCFNSHLKFIEVDWFNGLPNEMKMVEYILKNAKVLEKLTLHYTPKVRDSDEDSSFFKKLVMLPRSSPICKVEVV